MKATLTVAASVIGHRAQIAAASSQDWRTICGKGRGDLMMRYWMAAAAVAALGFGASASAQPLARLAAVLTSGGVYHVQACPDTPAPGAARCHAHIVSDNRGTLLTNRF